MIEYDIKQKNTEDEIAQMFLDECLYNAGLKEESPFMEESDEQKIKMVMSC